jgi:hypothetical protein
LSNWVAVAWIESITLGKKLAIPTTAAELAFDHIGIDRTPAADQR